MVKKLRRIIIVLYILLAKHLWSSDGSDFYEQLLTLVPPEADANAGLTVFPILAFPTGAEQQAMAGAYTAVARDTGFFEANAGGSAIMENTELGVYHVNLIADVNLDAITYAQRHGDLGLGAMVKLLHSPFTAYRIQGEQEASAYYLESVVGLNVSYSFLRNYYFSGISAGMNLKLAYRLIPAILYEHVLGSLDARDQSAIGVMADFGVLGRFDFLKAYVSRDRNFSLGLSFKNLGLPVLEDPLPSMASLGISWSPFRFLLISGDINQPINLAEPTKSESLGFGTGVALQFTEFLAVRGGFQWKGNNPRFNLGTDLALDGLDLGVTYTLDYTSQLRIPDHLGIQVRFDLGDQGRKALRKQVDNLYIDALIALSAADYQEVIRLCKLCLELDPGYTPAKETMALALQSQDLIDKIEAIRLDEATVED